MRIKLQNLNPLSLILGLVIVLGACSTENISDNASSEISGDKELAHFVGGTPLSRTSLDYDSGDFFWEAGDKIYVQDDDGVWQVSSNAPSSKTANFDFRVPGRFTAHAVYKIFYPGKNGSNNQVIIPETQTQVLPNSTEHIGLSGDCGMTEGRWSSNNSSFEFHLAHKAAILVFQPFTNNAVLKGCRLTKIEVNSDAHITGTYTLDESTGKLSGTGEGYRIDLITKGGDDSSNGFALTNSDADLNVNGSYVVINPGTHTLKVRFWVKDPVTQTEGTITKVYPTFYYESDGYYDMLADLDVRNYAASYYMWDAENPYWYKHAWDKESYEEGVDQPTENGKTGSGSPHNAVDALHRWYNESNGSLEGSKNPLFNPSSDVHVPNANEMSWYVVKGDPHWDENELWSSMGHLHKGGMWLKKMSKIKVDAATEIQSAGGDVKEKGILNDGNYNDFRYTIPYATGSQSDIEKNPIPISESANYFYLPALSSYSTGTLGPWGYGYYWASSADPNTSTNAYHLFFAKSCVRMYGTFRGYGCIAMPFE